MATENIRIDYQVTGKKELDAANKSLETTAKANDVTQKEITQTNEKFEEQSKTVSKTSKAFTGLGTQLTSIGNRFTIAGKGAGDLAAGMFTATKATKGTTTAMKLLKVAIASTGIGLLIVSLGSLKAAFTASEAGQDRFAKLMDQIGVVVGNVSDVFASFGDQIISFFDGNGFDSSKVTGAIDDVINKTKEEVAEAGRLADLRAATNKLEREFLVKTARLDSKVADLRLKGRMEDEFTAKQRLAFLNEANDIQNELIETELIIARNRAEEIRISNTFSKSTRENLDEEAAANANVFNVQKKRLDQTRTLQREINTTSKQAQAALVQEAKANQDIIDKKEEQRLLDREAREVKKEEDREDLEKAITDAQEQANKILSIKEKQAQDSKDLEDKELQNKKDATGQAINIAKGLANSEGTINKGLALASIFFDTKAAIVKANLLSPLTFGQPFAGFAIATGAINAAAVSGLTPKFEKGGRIGGKRHSQGGTLIEGEIGEHMINRKATSKYGHDLFDSINNLELDPSILNGKTGGSNVTIVDTKPIADQLKSMPKNMVNIDSEGYTVYQSRQNATTIKKVNRYST